MNDRIKLFELFEYRSGIGGALSVCLISESKFELSSYRISYIKKNYRLPGSAHLCINQQVLGQFTFTYTLQNVKSNGLDKQRVLVSVTVGQIVRMLV
jgi:hypothetical protein